MCFVLLFLKHQAIKYDSDNMELIFTEEKHLRLIQRCHMQFGAVAYIQMAKKMKFS